MTIAITLSALIALAPTLSNQNAFAKTYTMKIVNDLEQDLIFQEIKNRQDIKIKSNPPDEVKSGDTGSFEIADGDSGKPKHLNVKYYVGGSGSDTIVTIGVKPTNTADNSFKCFTESPDNIKSECVLLQSSNTEKYTFSPK